MIKIEEGKTYKFNNLETLLGPEHTYDPVFKCLEYKPNEHKNTFADLSKGLPENDKRCWRQLNLNELCSLKEI